jgi:ABC-type sugar transport system ATPase subunit
MNIIEKPINLILLGPAGSGKSSTLNSIKSAYNNLDEIR